MTMSTDPFAPPAEYARLRREGGITRTVGPDGPPAAWLVTDDSLVRAVLADPRFGVMPPGPPPPAEPSLFTDGADHARLRRLLAPAFGPRRVAALRPRVEAVVDDLVGGLLAAGPGADLVAHLARPLPLAVIADVLGLDPDDRGQFGRWADVAVGLVGGGDPGPVWDELVGYLDGLVEAKRARPSQDVFSELIAVRDAEDGRLSDAELRTTAVALLVAGYGTTANALSIGLVTLLADHPWSVVRGREDAVVEEMLRRQSGRNGEVMPRFAHEDVPLGDVVVATGEQVLVRVASANHDPRVHDDPEAFVLDRASNPHLAFGHGPHRCLGAALARLELACAVTALATRAPDLALAVEPAAIAWTGHPLDDGPAELPVTWSIES